MKTIYNVYVPIESQPQADRMKQICIDYGLPYWYYKDAFEFFPNMYFFHNEWCGFSVDSYNGKPKKGYTQVTESEFLKLVKINFANSK